MIDVIGVRYKSAGKMYYFDPCDLEINVGDNVVVETARGIMLGEVIEGIKKIEESELEKPLKPVLRIATEEDLKNVVESVEKEGFALEKCAELVKKMNLPMKLLSADYNLDRSQLTIFFSAENRVDFRELVRELGKILRVRIELRQVGPRDEAKIVGGYGRCGRSLCCRTFLTEFNPVSIKMAKEQNLPLNSAKISGICGRLLCCLGYEYENYRCINKKMPNEGKRVCCSSGVGIVTGTNAVKETVTISLDGGASVECPYADIKTDVKAGVETIVPKEETKQPANETPKKRTRGKTEKKQS